MQMPLTWPNRITLARLAAIPLFVILLLRMREGGAYRSLSLGVFLAIGVLDVVDGWLARRLRQQTRLGAVIDPLADKLLLTIACVLLAFPEVTRPDPPLPKWLAVVAVSRDLFIVIGSLVLYVLIGRLYIHPTRLGRACTLSLTLTILTALLIGVLPVPARVWGGRALLVLVHVTGVLAVASGLHYGWLGRAQLGAAAQEPFEPPPR